MAQTARPVPSAALSRAWWDGLVSGKRRESMQRALTASA